MWNWNYFRWTLSSQPLSTSHFSLSSSSSTSGFVYLFSCFFSSKFSSLFCACVLFFHHHPRRHHHHFHNVNRHKHGNKWANKCFRNAPSCHHTTFPFTTFTASKSAITPASSSSNSDPTIATISHYHSHFRSNIKHPPILYQCRNESIPNPILKQC